MPKQSIYTVGGTVQAGQGIYIKRKADDELVELCRQGEFAFILSSRQVGKSSLMVRTAQQLEKENICSVIIDLSAIGINVSQDEWYQGILNEIYTTLNLETDIFTWWSQYAQLGPAQRLANFFKDVLLKEVKQQIVLFFDEIDSTLSIPFSDDFYIALRAVYNARSTNPDFKRLSFVLVGVAAPGDLISDSKRTPFNIGQRVEINDFTLAEALPLAGGLGEQAVQVLTWIFQYTNGHPYLTQRLCAYLASSKEVITESVVANAVDKLFTGEQGKQDNNLQFVRDMLSKRSPDVTRILSTYKAIRSGKNVTDDERSITKAHLKLSGLVRSEQGILRVRNEIYNQVFNIQWIAENTPRNWTKIAAFSLGIITFILLFIFIYDFVIDNISHQYVDKFYRLQTGASKLEYLAKLFDLEGILPNTDYDSRAREAFFGLSAHDQELIFNDVPPTAKAQYLGTVVRGLYVTAANVEGGSGQDSTVILEIMRAAVKNVDDNLYGEIDLWLQARDAALNRLTQPKALALYDNAINLNGDNPATHYERAALEIKLGQYEQALLDLNTTMVLAKTLSTDTTEATPVPLSTVASLSTQSAVPSTVVSTPPNSTEIPKSSLETVTPTQSFQPTLTLESTPRGLPVITATPGIDNPPTTLPVPTLQESYKSIFYNQAYIRSAVDQLIQESLRIPEFQVATFASNKYPALTGNGLLPSVAMLTSSPFPTWTEVPTATISTTPVPTDTVPPGEPTSTPVPIFSTQQPASTQPILSVRPSGYEIWGIDVGAFEPNIDWVKLKNQGINFVFIKASQADFTDSSFDSHWAGAKQAGIVRGAYHFLDPRVDCTLQAETFLKTVQLESNDLPPVLDIETLPALPGNLTKTPEITNAQIVSCAQTWLTLVQAGTGRRPIIYSSGPFLQSRVATSAGRPPSWAANYTLWIANYFNHEITSKDIPFQPAGWPDWTFWQYTESGKLDGVLDSDGKLISTYLDVFRGSQDDFQKFMADSFVQK